MKKLELEIKGCEECPYCHYNCYYNMSQDSGWDCEHSDTKHSRIIDEGPNDISPKGTQANDRIKRILKTQVPDWCPLPDIIFNKNK